MLNTFTTSANSNSQSRCLLSWSTSIRKKYIDTSRAETNQIGRKRKKKKERTNRKNNFTNLDGVSASSSYTVPFLILKSFFPLVFFALWLLSEDGFGVCVFIFRAFISRRRRKKMASGGGTSSKEKKGFSVNPKDYKLMEEVGNGASAVVHLAIYLPTKEVIAIKCLNLDRCNSNLVPFLNPSPSSR